MATTTPTPPTAAQIGLQMGIDALNAAIASGERMVVLNGQSVTYRSIPDLILARNDLQRQLNDVAVQGLVRPKRTYAHYAGRGYA